MTLQPRDSQTGQFKSRLCLNCGIQHVQHTSWMNRGLLEAGLEQDEIDEIFDQIESRAEIPSFPNLHDLNPAILANLKATGVVSDEELEEWAEILEERHPAPQDDPSSTGYVPEAYKTKEDPAVLQARKEAAERARKARFAQNHPSKHAEYQRKYRKNKKKPE